MTTKITIKKPNLNFNLDKEIREKVAAKIIEHAVLTAPVDIGNYQSHIKFDGANTVIAEAKYSAAIEYGVQEHDIYPVEKKALAFKVNGKNVVVKKAHIPARKPNPVMRNAAKETQKEVPQIVKDIFKENGIN